MRPQKLYYLLANTKNREQFIQTLRKNRVPDNTPKFKKKKGPYQS